MAATSAHTSQAVPGRRRRLELLGTGEYLVRRELADPDLDLIPDYDPT